MGVDKNRRRACEIAEQLQEGSFQPCEGEAIADMSRKLVGAVGEMVAAQFLEQRGLEVIERNYRCCEGEADLIALDPATEEVVLVEVKTRRGRVGALDRYPEEAVTAKKRRRYRRIAYHFAAERFPVASVRFDVIAVTLAADRVAEVCHMIGVFDWEAE